MKRRAKKRKGKERGGKKEKKKAAAIYIHAFMYPWAFNILWLSTHCEGPPNAGSPMQFLLASVQYNFLELINNSKASGPLANEISRKEFVYFISLASISNIFYTTVKRYIIE